MAYLVKGRAITSYYDVKFNKIAPHKFQHAFAGADSEDAAVEAARWMYQTLYNQLVIIDSVEFVEYCDDDHSANIDWNLPWYEQRIVSFDVETTGLSPVDERIAEIAFSVFELGSKKFGEPESYFLNDGVPMSDGASALNGITDEMLKGAPTFKELLPEFIEKYVQPGTIFVAHNRGFDMAFWLNSVERAGKIIAPPCWCSMELAIRTPVGQEKNRLEHVAAALQVEGQNSHRAGDDAQLAGDVFLALARRNKFFLNASTRDVMHFFDNNPTMESYGYSRF